MLIAKFGNLDSYNKWVETNKDKIKVVDTTIILNGSVYYYFAKYVDI